MAIMTLTFTVCTFIDQIWVDVHLAGGGDNGNPVRLGRLIFEGPRGLVAWTALVSSLQAHAEPWGGLVRLIFCEGTPDTVNYDAIPPLVMDGLQAHVEHGKRPGDFVRSVLENDLAEAVGRADEHSLSALRDTVAWLWNNAPPECWGDQQKVQEWREAGGKQGRAAAQAAAETEEAP